MKKMWLLSAVASAALVMSGCGGSDEAPVVSGKNPDIGGDKILFYSTSGAYKGAANVGNLPDMVTFSHDGKFLVTANEGEPNDDLSEDPEGSISIIEIDSNIEGFVKNVSTLYFSDANVPADVRIKPGATASIDIEPEYVAISEDDKKAFVTLQENNAVAIVDLTTKKITSVKSLGAKDFDKIDIDSKDDVNVSTAPDNIYGLYMPDTIATYKVGGADFFVTANEGDDRDDWSDVYTDYYKASDLNASLVSAQLTTDILDVSGKKKIRVLNDMGKDENGIYQAFYMSGTRSFSIWDADGNQVFDSGSQFEETVAASVPVSAWNTRVDDSDDFADVEDANAQLAYTEFEGDFFFWEGTDARS